MYIKNDPDEAYIAGFKLPFGGTLDPYNRWIKLHKIIPWDKIEEEYAKHFTWKKGAPAKNVRMAFGALVIQTKTGLSDRELVEQIKENPYYQFFIGLEEFTKKKAFHHSMMTHFRKKFSAEMIEKINEWIVLGEAKEDKHDNDGDDDGGDSMGQSDKSEIKDKDGENGRGNKGTLILDATCAPSDIAYPTDLRLLNEGRLITEKIIDKLFEELVGTEKKPRTYRQRAKRDYLSISKQRRPKKKTIRKAIRKQLGYLRRNLLSIEKLNEKVELTKLDRQLYKKLLVVNEVYRQQEEMYRERKHKISGRIVSISQPHVRPIVRGKAGQDVEFGAKITISLVNGFTHIDKKSWENYNEAVYMEDSIEKYKTRFGYYPEKVLADQIFRNKKNRVFCKSKGIKLSGPPLGRPPIYNTEEYRKRKREESEDFRKRVEVEGKFGESKRIYGLGRIMTKLDKTSETTISLIFLVMNLNRKLRLLVRRFFSRIFGKLFLQNTFNFCA